MSTTEYDFRLEEEAISDKERMVLGRDAEIFEEDREESEDAPKRSKYF